MARRRQGNWRKDSSGAWFQMNVVRGVKEEGDGDGEGCEGEK